MKVAVIADIHANEDALLAVLAEIARQEVAAIYCLGDVIGYGADPAPCVRLVQEHCAVVLQGNHEQALLHPDMTANMNEVAVKALRWNAENLGEAELAMIRAWPLSRVVGNARLVHGSPYQPTEFHYLRGLWEVELAFTAFGEKVCCCGHTHVPAAAEEALGRQPRLIPLARTASAVLGQIVMDPACRYLINAGSVGQPRNQDPRAAWVTIEQDPPRIQWHACAYDVAAASRKIIQAGLPAYLAERIKRGR